MQNPQLSTEGPDVAYIGVESKLKFMQRWLHEEKVLLLRSPPGSGKTTFALSFAAYLRSHGFKAVYLNASLSENTVGATRSMDAVWRAAFESEQSFSQMCKQVLSDEVYYVIIDEAQTWYPSNLSDPTAKTEVYKFWADTKFYVKPALQLANIGLSSYATLLSMHPPASTTGLRVLCLAGYGEANVGTFSTPVGFMDPQDPVTRLRLPLGLDFLRLDRESTKQLILRFTKIQTSHRKALTFDAEVFNLIYDETNGHVGAIRMLLHYLVDTRKRSKQLHS